VFIEWELNRPLAEKGKENAIYLINLDWIVGWTSCPALQVNKQHAPTWAVQVQAWCWASQPIRHIRRWPGPAASDTQTHTRTHCLACTCSPSYSCSWNVAMDDHQSITSAAHACSPPTTSLKNPMHLSTFSLKNPMHLSTLQMSSHMPKN